MAKTGRPPVSPELESEILKCFKDSGHADSFRSLARHFEVSPSTVSRVLKSAGVAKRVAPESQFESGPEAEDQEVRVSMRDVARLARVSVGTVSLALKASPKVLPQTARKVLDAAQQLGYAAHPYVSANLAAVRRGRVRKVQATIAYLYSGFSGEDGDWEEAFERPGGPKVSFEGARAAARSRGYRLEYFPFLEKGRSMKRLRTILESRGIRGLLLDAPAAIVSDHPFEFERFSTVALGDQNAVRTHVFGPDHFLNVLRCVCQLWRMGYRRIGGVVGDAISVSTLFMRDAGMRHAQHHLIPHQLRLPLLNLDTLAEAYLDFLRMEKLPEDRHRIAEFEWLFGEQWPELEGSGDEGLPDFDVVSGMILERWIKTYRPEVIICETSEILPRLQAMGIRVPDDVGVVHLNHASDVANWTGMRSAHEMVAASAVEHLCDTIDLGQVGLPKVPIRQRIAGEWVEGETTRSIDPPLVPFSSQADRFISRALSEPVEPYVPSG